MSQRQARLAFADGWSMATATHPVTPSATSLNLANAVIRAGLTTEATLKLGHLDGVWAVLYDRRDKAEARWKVTIAAHVRLLSSLVAWDDVVRAVGPRETRADDAKVLARQAAARLNDLRNTKWWTDLALDIEAAMLEGSAEGRTQAIALLADSVGVTVDYAVVFTDAMDALSDIGSFYADADTWVAKFVDAFANDVGNALATAWEKGADYQGLMDVVGTLIDGDDRAIGYVVDMAMGNSLSMGSLTTYDSAGIALADFISAGDDTVCPECDDAEAGNSYTVADLMTGPVPPLHPSCRCAVSPVVTDTGDLSALWSGYEIDLEG